MQVEKRGMQADAIANVPYNIYAMDAKLYFPPN
jgi:hypothetical protein